MKLNKFLTALTPIAVVGTIAPIISSCGGKDYVINYGDNINCRDKKEEGYQKPDVVKKQIKLKAQKEKAGEFDVDAVNTKIYKQDTQTYQNIYYDLVASWLILSGSNIRLTQWEHSFTGAAPDAKLNIKFDLNNGEGLQEYTNVHYEYNDDGEMYITFGANQLYRSYIYEDCTEPTER